MSIELPAAAATVMHCLAGWTSAGASTRWRFCLASLPSSLIREVAVGRARRGAAKGLHQALQAHSTTAYRPKVSTATVRDELLFFCQCCACDRGKSKAQSSWAACVFFVVGAVRFTLMTARLPSNRHQPPHPLHRTCLATTSTRTLQTHCAPCSALKSFFCNSRFQAAVQPPTPPLPIHA